MSQDMIDVRTQLPAELADVFNADDLAGDLYDGIQGGFAVVSIRGSRWRISKGGDAEPVLNADGEPVPSLECVIIKASRNVSKIYYAESYAEGDAEAPDCWSIDGKTPDAGAENPQSASCAGCPQNVWGSKITPAGKKTKACGDNRRIAVVPLGDILNKKYDGAMLLRVPAASLTDLALYGKGMAAKGFPYNAIGTRMGFDMEASYPKLTFRPIKPLTMEQLAQVAEVSRSATVQSILEVASDITTAAATKPQEPEPTVGLDFEAEAEPEEAPDTAAADAAALKKAAAAEKRKATAAKKKKEKEDAEAATAAAATEVVIDDAPSSSEAEDSLDDLLADLDSLG
ncbi:MAG: hypothetical protein DRI24_16990 [Deltaproteobacteria bacterium]|nr:MAG: hypothetical protein DRI24_16990 [Deltaproteobacteria bacterium]